MAGSAAQGGPGLAPPPQEPPQGHGMPPQLGGPQGPPGLNPAPGPPQHFGGYQQGPSVNGKHQRLHTSATVSANTSQVMVSLHSPLPHLVLSVQVLPAVPPTAHPIPPLLSRTTLHPTPDRLKSRDRLLLPTISSRVR